MVDTLFERACPFAVFLGVELADRWCIPIGGLNFVKASFCKEVVCLSEFMSCCAGRIKSVGEKLEQSHVH